MLKKKSILKAFLFFSILTCSLLLSCNTAENNLTSALEQAGSNKSELLKVINHYKKVPADSLKLKAAYFLIENMPEHFAYDTTYLYKYRPVIKTIDSLRLKGFSTAVIRDRANPIMDGLINRYSLSYIYSVSKNDVTTIKSAYLIKSIDQAFDAYQNNLFKDQILFADFLNYILPYRISDGYAIEAWRTYFTATYFIKNKNDFATMQQLCDSLLYNFKDVKIGWMVAEQFPYLKLKDYLTSKMTNCPQKSWFNCMLLRSFGIPVTLDFVPVARVHTLGHQWNALKLKNGTFPFESFWVDSLRNLKPLYTREKNHPDLGPIQFPKIYRKTFKLNKSELLSHSISTGEDIPPFFRDPFLKDVSEEYFKTFNLKSPIVQNIKNLKYAYACVLGTGQNWIPVDFGKIKDNTISFNSLGSENVYLPAYFYLDAITPAGYPVLLNNNGSQTILKPDILHTREITVSSVAYRRPEELQYKQAFIGATIEGSNDKNFKHFDILLKFRQAYEAGDHRVLLRSKKTYRYIRLSLPNSKIKLNEIRFFTNSNKAAQEVRGRLINSSAEDSLRFKKLVDQDLLTGTIFTSLNEEAKPKGKIWIGYDLKKSINIDAFEFYFALASDLRKEGLYELFYWDFGWKSLGVKKSYATKPISFFKVPKNALLMVKSKDTGSYTRIFTYEYSKQNWY